MNQFFEDGQHLQHIWWDQEGTQYHELFVNDCTGRPPNCESMVIREQYCGDRSEWFVKCKHTNNKINYFNMKYLGGFSFLGCPND